MNTRIAFLTAAVLCITELPALAQSSPLPSSIAPSIQSQQPTISNPTGTAATSDDEGRACNACPKRSVGQALFDALLVNVVYGTVNIVRGQETRRITSIVFR